MQGRKLGPPLDEIFRSVLEGIDHLQIPHLRGRGWLALVIHAF